MTRLFEAGPDERIAEFLSRAPELSPGALSPLAGDASNRLYFRLEIGPGETRIVSCLPAPFDPADLPFLQVLELFEAIPLRVPRVEGVAGDLGILLLEDLGDRLLQDEAGRSAAPERRRTLYHEALDLLSRLQRRGRELESEGYLPFRIAFDADKFLSELQFFRRHFLESFSGASIGEAEASDLDSEMRLLASELASQPFALCHRDYHSRNLILCDSGLAVIDFQDARMGPRSYDLVSLLNDSYVALDDAMVAEMTDRFAAEAGAEVLSEYDVAALQRNLKALGTFGFQIVGRGNDVYRAYVEHTLSLVRANLERNPRWDRLRRILARHLRELA